MNNSRHLEWDGGFNIRDLGGISLCRGGETRRQAVIRSGNLHLLSKVGWAALHAYGVRTIIDLRDTAEREAQSYVVPYEDVCIVHVPIEEHKQQSDFDFWKRWRSFNASPLYYTAFLNQFPDRSAAVVQRISRAQPGGVLMHCGIGRDRTGLMSLVVLSIVGALAEDIASDYASSAERLRPQWSRLGLKNDEESIAMLFEQEKTSSSETIHRTLATLDPLDHVRRGGACDEDIEALQIRLVGKPVR